MHGVPVFGTCPARLRKRRSATYRPRSGHKEGARLASGPAPRPGPAPRLHQARLPASGPAPPGPASPPGLPIRRRPGPKYPAASPPAHPAPAPRPCPAPPRNPALLPEATPPAGTAQFPEAPPHPPPGPPICPMLRPPPGLRVGPRPQPRSVGEHPWRQAPVTLILWVPREAGSGVSALGFSLKWAQTHTRSPIRALTASHHLTDEDGETRVETEEWALRPAAQGHSTHSARTGTLRWVCYLVIKLFTAVSHCDPLTALQ